MADQDPKAPRFVVHQAAVPNVGSVTLKMDQDTGQCWVLVRTYLDTRAFHWEKVADQAPESTEQERPQPV
jgi:hypothetical protein